MEMIKFLLAVSGFTFIVVKSNLFVGVRAYFTDLYRQNKKNKFYWFVDSILGCPMCFSVWGGLILALMKYFLCSYYEFVALIFSGVAITAVISSFYEFLNRK